MKKSLLIVCLLFIFSGCVASDSNSLTNELDNVFNNIDSIKEYYPNNTMRYYSYYLPSDMGEEEIDSESVTIRYNNSTVVMNLNIADIINEKYYSDELLKDDGFFDEQYLIYEKTGTYLKDENQCQYTYKLYKKDDVYIIHLKTVDINFYGSSNISDVIELSKHLLMISKSITSEKDTILKNYYKKDVIDYSKKQIDLFDSSLPSNGKLSDMLTDNAVVKDGSNITSDDKEIEETPAIEQENTEEISQEDNQEE